MRTRLPVPAVAAALALLAGCQTLPAPAAPFVAVPGFGQAAAMPDAALRPSPDSDVRAVFPATRAAPAPDQALPALDRAARYLNLLSQEGVRIQPGDVVVVISGPATPAVLTDARYQARFSGASGNPNLPLIRALADAGAVVSVCGQALNVHGFAAADVAPEVRLDLAAMTTLVELQARGHALVPE